jgi:hypothetical protein
MLKRKQMYILVSSFPVCVILFSLFNAKHRKIFNSIIVSYELSSPIEPTHPFHKEAEDIIKKTKNDEP